MRVRAAAVVIADEALLVIGRRNGEREYSVLPGGGVEDGETHEEACLRELREETGLVGAISVGLRVPADPAGVSVYFSVSVNARELRLGGPELERASETNVYEPRWVPLESVSEIGLVPASALAAVEAGLRLRDE